MKKTIVYAVAAAFVFSVALSGLSMAQDKGPAEMTLKSTIDGAKKPKPAHFPHAEHQKRLECGECHHTKGADGKQVPYSEGMKIQKCESCHNKGAGMPKGLQTFKDVGHKNCKGCHKSTGKKELTKCSTCHPKKK
ncbi:cytochrome c3 family protein [Desulfolithobacter sp.]